MLVVLLNTCMPFLLRFSCRHVLPCLHIYVLVHSNEEALNEWHMMFDYHQDKLIGLAWL